MFPLAVLEKHRILHILVETKEGSLSTIYTCPGLYQTRGMQRHMAAICGILLPSRGFPHSSVPGQRAPDASADYFPSLRVAGTAFYIPRNARMGVEPCQRWNDADIVCDKSRPRRSESESKPSRYHNRRTKTPRGRSNRSIAKKIVGNLADLAAGSPCKIQLMRDLRVKPRLAE